ncbi:carbohydrate porin [Verminephrobacter aporrectodeae]|uniref:carbohydrate porin n=1 Tax=Verminephrobacter aporrectodeae TaxID=1110389 RepID=UPI002238DD23|nr:carbohydrate porin [Verminephrobacter aporrectodeae]
MMKKRLTAVALAAACATNGAMALDVAGFEITGYSRGGPVFGYSDDVKGGLSLGGDLQKYRLGNEGDYGIEVGIARSFESGGVKWSVNYMPSKWGSGDVATEMAYVEMSGLSFLPDAKFWAGQRRLRIEDVHIVDNVLVNYGDYQGAGVTDIPLGGAKLGLGVFTGDQFDKRLPSGVKANRFNADFSEIKVNPGGKLRVLLTAVGGKGQVGGGSGSGVSLLHNQSDLGLKGMSNSMFLQTSRGHARIDGEFESIDGKSVGKKALRIADAIGWQSGPFGGQALIGYQTGRADAVGAVTTKDFSLGGRASYAFTKNFKGLTEVSTTTRKSAGMPNQRLNKFTLAGAVALSEDFWSRPELRLYVTKANWNRPAAMANAASFGANGKTSRTLMGLQYEVWW